MADKLPMNTAACSPGFRLFLPGMMASCAGAPQGSQDKVKHRAEFSKVILRAVSMLQAGSLLEIEQPATCAINITSLLLCTLCAWCPVFCHGNVRCLTEALREVFSWGKLHIASRPSWEVAHNKKLAEGCT